MRRWIPLVLGAIIPVVLLFFDPVVFRVNDLFNLGSAQFGAYRAFGYVATVLVAALMTRATFKPAISRIEAGMLYGAALVSLALGIALLPLSLFGILFFGIGLLGFWPLGAAWIYFREARRQRAAWTGVLVFMIVPLAAQIGTNGVVAWGVKHSDSSAAAILLRAIAPLYDADLFVQRFRESESNADRRRLAQAFHLMTGRSLEERLAALVD